MTRTREFPEALQRLRASCPLVDQSIYLANCSQAPQAAPVRAAIAAFMEDWATRGMNWEGWITVVEQARASFAALINAEPADIAVGTSVSQLVSSLTSALVRPDAPRRRLITSVVEFPGVAHAWQAAVQHTPGWELGILTSSGELSLAADAPVPPPQGATDPAVTLSTERFLQALDERTALISVPQVLYANGARQDIQRVAEAAHVQGALVFVDAYQALGTVPLEVKASGVDFLAAGTLKYLLGTAGIAFLYVRPGLREQLTPSVTGWFGRVAPFAYDPTYLDYAPMAARFDLGTPPLINAYAAKAGIDLVRETGVEVIAAQVARLSALFWRVAPALGLRILGPHPGAPKGATNAVDAGSPQRARALEEVLRQQKGVIVSARGNALRLAPHGFTREDEFEHALQAVSEVLEHAPVAG
ncbi:MAG TPA: aminotransferase class V-fold PLP-dependent enzyme [Ktedonobacterales bacterium]